MILARLSVAIWLRMSGPLCPSIEQHFADTRRHADRVGDVEHLFAVAARRQSAAVGGIAHTAVAVHRNVGDRHVRRIGDAELRIEQRHVVALVAVERKHRNGLSRARQRTGTVIHRAHVARQEVAARTRARRVRHRLRAGFHARLRRIEIVQARKSSGSAPATRRSVRCSARTACFCHRASTGWYDCIETLSA